MSQGTSKPSGAPQQPSQRQLEGDRMDIDTVEPRVPSSEPAQPLSGGQAMNAALSDIQADIQTQAAASRSIRNARKQYEGPNPADIMQQRLAATEASAPAKRPRTFSADSPTELDTAKRTKIGSQHVIEFQKPAKSRPTSFEHLVKPQKVPCAVMIDNLHDSIMGDPTRPVPGCQIKLNIDPGRHGQPSIGIDFKLSKDSTNVSNEGVHNTFTLGWEPGVKIGEQWMMQNLHVGEAASPANASMAELYYPDAISKLCKKKSDAERLICMTFRSNAHKISPIKDEWVANWPAVLRNTDRILHGTDPGYQVTVWFLTPTTNIDRAWREYLKPFADAVEDHTPPFHQYLDDDDKPFIDERLPTVDAIGNGMYRRYPKLKSGKLSNRRGTVSYHTMPRVVTWNSIKSFHVTHGVPIVRDMQYSKGLHIGLEDQWHRVFLQRMPSFNVDGKALQPAPMRDTCLAGIRLTRNAEGVKEAIPELGSTVVVEFNNGDSRIGRAHARVQHQLCYGRVDNYGGKAFLDKTKTDFAVLLTMARKHPFPTHTELMAMEDNQLALAKISVKVNNLPSIRNIHGFNKFCNPNHLPELLDPIRLAMWSEPSRVPAEVVDLTEGPAYARSEENRAKYAAIINAMKAKRKSNRSQDDVLMAPAAMEGKIAMVQGPPGAGKTRTLRDLIIALAKVGHKVLCVASSNVAVDTDAQAVWRGLTPEDRKVIKCLRLETDGAEKAQRLTKLNYADYTGQEGEADESPEYAGPEMASDHPAVRNALDKLCVEWAHREDYARKAFAKYKDLERAYQAIQNYDAIKKSNVPNGMTLDYRQWLVTQGDRDRAQARYEELRSSMSTEEFRNQHRTGELDVNKLDDSFEFRERMSKHIAEGGKLKREEKNKLEAEVIGITRRVLADTHILFSTASNCGGALLEDVRDFAPTIIICDEAGQVDIPGLSVPLTVFDSWEALFLFGDIKQLEPTVLSGNFNEFIANAKMSPLALLAYKGHKSMMLEEQYRMAPACSRFPRTQFYDGKGLKDSEAVLQDNEVRKAIRQLAKSLQVQGDNGDGSEYFVTDVVNGYSRVELGGTSLVNYANADVIRKIVQRLLTLNGGLIKPRMIKILTYYQGQRRLLRGKINEIQVEGITQAMKDAVDISTVDSFQGNESKIVILDMVAAKGNLGEEELEVEAEADDEEGDEDPGTEDYVKSGRVTGHVRSPNRLNVALTRGQDATLVVCQAGLLAQALKKNRGKHYNATVNMISDAQDRNCFLTDHTEDSHPLSVQRREQLAAATLQKNTDNRRRESLKFISEGRRHWDIIRNESSLPTIPPYLGYRVQGGHTTRPIGNPEIVRSADEFDEAARAKAASIETAKVEAENRLRLNIATQASLEESFPPLPTKQPQEAERMAVDSEDQIDYLDAQGREIVVDELLSPEEQARQDEELGLDPNRYD